MKYSIFITLMLFVFIAIVPLAYANDDSVNLSDFPQKLADALAIPLFAGQILASTIFIGLFLFPTLLLTRGINEQLIIGLLVGLSTMSFTIAVGWLPWWLLLMVVLITALMFAGSMRNWITGRAAT